MADLRSRAAVWRVGHEVEGPWQPFNSIYFTVKKHLSKGREIHHQGLRLNSPRAPSTRPQTTTPAPTKPRKPPSVHSQASPPLSQTPIATSHRTSKIPDSPSSPQSGETCCSPHPVASPAKPPAAGLADASQTLPPCPAKFRCASPLRSAPFPSGKPPRAKAPRRQTESPIRCRPCR